MRCRRTRTIVPHLLTSTSIAVLFVSWVPAEPPHDPGPNLGGFIENCGQIDSSVRFYTTAGRTAVYFTATGPVLEIRDLTEPIGAAVQPPRDYPIRARERRNPATPRRFAVGVRFLDTAGSAEIEGAGARRGHYSYLLGDEPRTWRSRVRAFERVVYHDVWPGIDLEYRLDGERLIYEVVPGPGAALSRVKFDYEGAAAVDAIGRTHRLETPLGVIEDRQPTVDDRTGEIRIAARAGVVPDESISGSDSPSSLSAASNGEQRIDVLWSSFLGGEGIDAVFGVALADGGYPVVTGTTRSVEFPTTLGVLDTTYNGAIDAFVTMFEADGTTLLWSTFLGGEGDDRGWAIEVDSSGRPIVVGVTSSEFFPTTPGAYDTTYNGGYDAFVVKLAADGTDLVWSTFFGGAEREWDLSGIDLDLADRPTFTGSTRSGDLPTSPGAYDAVLDGTGDAFVVQLEADGSALALSTYLGGDDSDVGEDVVLDPTGRPVVVGRTRSADFPTTPGAFQTSPGVGQDGFVAKLAVDAGSLVFSSFLGGNGDDECFAVTLDGSDRVLVTGGTDSTDFPTTPGSFQETSAGARDIFVSRFESDGTALTWGTYYGGEGIEDGLDIVTDSAGRPIFVGSTCSLTFPVAGPPFDDSYNFACDAFVAKLQEDGSSPVYSTYIGGNRGESAYGLALGPMDRPVVGGETLSGAFPTTSGAYDPTHNSPDSKTDGFLLVMFTPAFCTDVTGLTVPELTVAKTVSGNCPQGVPEGNLIDLIEGQLDQIGPAGIGNVEIVACDAPVVTFGTSSLPAPGEVLFQLARYSPGGTYADGGAPGLVGSRTPLDGDCP